jgi:HD-GYP domain-containing protein (c-di-GMP phosphodiesterase class II)
MAHPEMAGHFCITRAIWCTFSRIIEPMAADALSKDQAVTNADSIRTAEVVASLSLATDLGMGFPFEHGLQATLVTMRLCKALGVDPQIARQTYYASLLMYSGCTVEADATARLFPGGLTKSHTHRQFGSTLESLVGIANAVQSPGRSMPIRLVDAARRLPTAARHTQPHFAAMCEVAEMLAERLGLPPAIDNLFSLLTERWDGKSVLRRAKGDEVPLPLRIIHVGRDAAYQRFVGDDRRVVKVISSRAGKAFDPEVTATFVEHAGEILGSADPAESDWDATLAAEPEPWLTLEGDAIDRALAAMGAFADIATPFLSGHSSGVANLAAEAARLCRFDASDIVTIRCAGYLHDIGLSAVSGLVWAKDGPLNADEREQVRLHPYHTERILSRSPFLAPMARLAGAHHERLDGSGYYRGVGAGSLSPAARLLAAAAAFHSKMEPRPYRKALSPEAAAARLTEKGGNGLLDPEMVEAVVKAAGQAAPKLGRPAGLTEREAQVLGLLARGLQTKQIAHALDVSVKTADHHIQNAYRKIGVSTRAAATLFAAEHGLVR